MTSLTQSWEGAGLTGSKSSGGSRAGRPTEEQMRGLERMINVAGINGDVRWAFLGPGAGAGAGALNRMHRESLAREVIC